MLYKEIYKNWIENNYFDEKTREELKNLEGNEKEVEDIRSGGIGSSGRRDK